MEKVKLIVLLSFILLSFACNNFKFEKKGWMYKSDEGIYPNREKMFKDLTVNHKFKGLSYKKLIEEIGPDDNYNLGVDTCIFYNIVTGYGWELDPDPVYVKNLVFKLNKDNFVIDYKIEEWRHGENTN
jgi:hypothetical protein